MKTDLKAKLLQHLLKKKGNEGFTLIELLVVIIIIGILAAIALPAFLNQADRARQTEAQTYVGSVNRAQQAYRLEEATFADKISNLGLGIRIESENYTYGNKSRTTDETEPLGSGLGDGVGIWALTPADNKSLLDFVGATYLLLDAGNNVTTTAVLCREEQAGDAEPVITLNNAGKSNAEITETTDVDCG